MNWNSNNGIWNPSCFNPNGFPQGGICPDDAAARCHVHEYCGSTRFAQLQTNPHNHRFCGVTGSPIQTGNTHCHRLMGTTDFFEDHAHRMLDTTGPAIPVGNGRHVHFTRCSTSIENGHRHSYICATAIENPCGNC